MRAAVVGPGKMGSAIAAAWKARGHEVVTMLGRGDDPAAARGCDVAFELTRPEAAAANVEALLRAGVPTVCGTTGWDASPARGLSRELAVPLLVAANFSIGIAVLRQLVAEATRRLAPFAEFEPGIVERHHAAKVDSPSGTARMLAATVGEERDGNEPPVVALRHGGQPGEHQVIFEGAQECLELTHRVRSREVFALGAVAAGEWLAQQRPSGPVTFDDFLRQAAARPPANGEEMPWTPS